VFGQKLRKIKDEEEVDLENKYYTHLKGVGKIFWVERF
jgi:hypothetical protein